MTENIYDPREALGSMDFENSSAQTQGRVLKVRARGGRWIDPSEQVVKTEEVIILPDIVSARVSADSEQEKQNLAQFLAGLSLK